MMELIFRKISHKHYAVFGITDTRVEVDTWARFEGMLRVTPISTAAIQFPNMNLREMDCDELLTSIQWETAGGWGTAIMRPSNHSDYSLIIGAMSTDTMPWPLETLLLFDEDVTVKDIQPTCRGNVPRGIFRDAVWGPDLVGFGSTFPPSLCKEMDHIRNLALAAYKALGEEGLLAVYESQDFFIRHCALENLRKEKDFRDMVVELGLGHGFSSVYTRDEDASHTQAVTAYIKRTRS